MKVTSHILTYGLRRPAALASSFLILSFSLSLPSLPQVTSASSCSPRACRVWTSTCAGASQVRLKFWTSDGHINLTRFGGLTRFLISSFLTLSFFLSLPSHPQGAVDKLVLPEGMQSVNFAHCYKLTGTAESQGVRFLFI